MTVVQTHCCLLVIFRVSDHDRLSEFGGELWENERFGAALDGELSPINRTRKFSRPAVETF